MADIEFPDVFSIVRGGLNPGRLKLNKTGIVFKSSKTGVLDSIPLAEIENSNWMRVARGFGIKITAKNGTEYRYHGFKEGEYEKLKEHYKKYYELDLNTLELSVKGWNWGAAKFKDFRFLYFLTTLFHFGLAFSIELSSLKSFETSSKSKTDGKT